jgi:cytochrome c553
MPRQELELAMQKWMTSLLLAFFALFLTITAASVVSGKPEYTKKENTPCATCHTRAGAKELNDVGKCYAEKHSLTDCQIPKEKSK